MSQNDEIPAHDAIDETQPEAGHPLEGTMDVDTGKTPPGGEGFGESVAQKALRKLKRDKLGLAGLAIVVLYGLVALGVKFGLFCTLADATAVVGRQFVAPGQVYQHQVEDAQGKYTYQERVSWFGTDIAGNDVFSKLIYSVKQAFAIGLFVSVFAVALGTLFGLLAGYFGGWIDDVLLWLYTAMSSIPSILWIVSISYAFGKGFLGVVMALSLTFWLGPFFSIRAEVRKIKEMEFVLAAESFGMPRTSILFGEILPNLTHLVFIFLSLMFIAAIKNEVILSFLGLGIAGEPSWGLMISNARLDLLAGKWWEVTGATVLLFILVMAFNLFTDALQDAFDPKKI